MKSDLEECHEHRGNSEVQQLHEMAPKILISTTVPETFATILRGQPGYLASRFQVTLATSPADMLAKVETAEGLRVLSVPMARGINPLGDIKSIVRMIQVLREVRPQLVHSYTPKAGLVTMLAAWLCRVPVRVHTFTGLIFPTAHGIKQRILIWVDRLICFCSTRIVPEGLGVKRDLEKFGITRKPLYVIGSGNIAGVDTSYFSPALSGIAAGASDLKVKLAIEDRDFVFCFVGRLNRDKGVAELVSAFSVLPKNAILILVGAIDETAPVDENTLEMIASDQRIHHLGFMDDIRPALMLADVLVLPSYREGFPNVILQAGSMELPVIATDINGCNEVIEDGFNGWLVPPRDAVSLGRVMKSAMESPLRVLREMGVRARARIHERFERSQHWDRMIEFYSKLLNT